MRQNQNVAALQGNKRSLALPVIVMDRDPSAQDFNYLVGQLWLNQLTQRVFMLSKRTAITGGYAPTWTQIGTASDQQGTNGQILIAKTGNPAEWGDLFSSDGTVTITPNVTTSGSFTMNLQVPMGTQTATVQTTDDTPTQIGPLLTVPTNGSQIIHVTVTGYDTGTPAEGIIARITAGVVSPAGAAAIVGTYERYQSDNFSVVGAQATVDISGPNARVVVEGLAATTIDWKIALSVVDN